MIHLPSPNSILNYMGKDRELFDEEYHEDDDDIEKVDVF